MRTLGRLVITLATYMAASAMWLLLCFAMAERLVREVQGYGIPPTSPFAPAWASALFFLLAGIGAFGCGYVFGMTRGVVGGRWLVFVLQALIVGAVLEQLAATGPRDHTVLLAALSLIPVATFVGADLAQRRRRAEEEARMRAEADEAEAQAGRYRHE